MYQKYLSQNYKKYYSGKKRKNFLFLLVILPFLGMFWAAYKNYDVILLYFKKNKHVYFENKIDTIQKEIYKQKSWYPENKKTPKPRAKIRAKIICLRFRK